MNKNQLVSAVATKADCSKEEALACCDAMVETIMEALKEGDKVALAGFGTFEVKVRAARTGINPATREKIEIPETKVINFKAAKTNKEAL
ncbi:MAG: HU family DNA-binding protein [Clostridia bacterium]|nr:HU family DNA-binding protein [Clostridia bacterium]MDE7079793.1 HU family DNA-binding protein [Clostridia bacterium]